MIAAWDAGDIDAALAGMHDAVAWHVAAGALPPLEAGDRLFVKGIDAYNRTTGTVVAMPYAAVIEFEGGRIIAWCDDIDTRRMEKLREGATVPGHLSALVERLRQG